MSLSRHQFAIEPTAIDGCHVIRMPVSRDQRGEFVKTFQATAFRRLGLRSDFVEDFVTVSRLGVLRGLHFQVPPHEQAKLVFCISGRIFDAAVDLRRGRLGAVFATVLDSNESSAVYLPAGVAHGFYVLSEIAVVGYKVTSEYSSRHDEGILWSSAGIDWPDRSPLVSERDRAFPRLADYESPFAHE